MGPGLHLDNTDDQYQHFIYCFFFGNLYIDFFFGQDLYIDLSN